jgi:hypothetical protein
VRRRQLPGACGTIRCQQSEVIGQAHGSGLSRN